MVFPKNPSAIGSATIALNLGFLIGTTLSMYICLRIKAYVYIGLTLASLLAIFTLEIKGRRKKAKKSDEFTLNIKSIDYMDSFHF